MLQRILFYAGHGTLESSSQEHFDEIMKLVEQAQLPKDVPAPEIHELVERGKALIRRK